MATAGRLCLKMERYDGNISILSAVFITVSILYQVVSGSFERGRFHAAKFVEGRGHYEGMWWCGAMDANGELKRSDLWPRCFSPVVFRFII